MSETKAETKILSRTRSVLSKWVTLVEKMVLAPGREKPESFHSLDQFDYLTILARTPSGKFPVIRQFRQSVETYTLEFPAGLKDSDDDIEEICAAELREEAGVDLLRLVPLGSFFADTGRLANKLHIYFAEVSEPNPKHTIEPGLSVQFLSLKEIEGLIESGQFPHQPHLGALYLAKLRGLI